MADLSAVLRSLVEQATASPYHLDNPPPAMCNEPVIYQKVRKNSKRASLEMAADIK